MVLWIAGLLTAGLAVAGLAIAVDGGSKATVLRIIDGDTIEVSLRGERETVRLLNIDTPETKHPDKSVQCLGPEATAFLEELLPTGIRVDLEYDQERFDKYGRTLAGVFLGEQLVNAEIAAQGLGVAVVYEPNRRFYDQVKAAEMNARDAKTGLFSPDLECTIAGQLEELQQQIEGLDTSAPETVEEAEALLAGLEGPVNLTGHYMNILFGDDEDDSSRHFEVVRLAYADELAGFKQQLSDHRDALNARDSQLRDAKTEIEAEEERQRLEEERKKEEERKRLEEERRKEEERIAAEEERQRQVAEAARQQQEAAEAERRRQEQQQRNSSNSSGNSSGQSGSNTSRNNSGSGYGTDSDYPGYTGPRCYAPGGRSWKPC